MSGSTPASGQASRSRRLSLLFVVPTLQGGGAERVVLTILRHMDRTKFDLTLAVIDSRDPVYLPDVPTDVELIDLGCRRVRYGVSAVLRLIWRRRPDIVFSVIGHLNLLMALLRPVLPRRVRLIGRETVVVSEHLRWQRWARVMTLAYRKLYRRFDRVVCQSEDMQSDLVERLHVPLEKTLVIHNPVDVDRVTRLAAEAIAVDPHFALPSRADGIHLVAAGRLSHQKGFDLLIEAVALCADSRVRLTILGDGPLREELERLAQLRGIRSSVRFVGFQRNPYAYFRRADAFVLSSRYEGLPNVVLEALACGAPVIATPALGGVLEILQGRPDCVIANTISAEGLAEAIRKFPFDATRKGTVPRLDGFAAQEVCGKYAALFSATADGAP